MDLEFFIDPADAPRCGPVIERMKKLQLPVRELDAATTRKLNGHSVAFVPMAQDIRRTGRHTHLQKVYVRYAGAPLDVRGPAAACSGVIEVSAWDVGRADRAQKKDRMNILATQLGIAIENAKLELARRAKKEHVK